MEGGLIRGGLVEGTTITIRTITNQNQQQQQHQQQQSAVAYTEVLSGLRRRMRNRLCDGNGNDVGLWTVGSHQEHQR